MLPNLLIIVLIAAIIAGAIRKIIIDKKNGVQCSGCPQSKVGSGGCCHSQAASGSVVNGHHKKV